MAASWAVVDQAQTTAKDPTGNYISVVRVIFTVGGNGPFSVDIPTATFSPGAAQAVIQTYADNVAAVAALTGP